jgi:hypothetical protein
MGELVSSVSFSALGIKGVSKIEEPASIFSDRRRWVDDADEASECLCKADGGIDDEGAAMDRTSTCWYVPTGVENIESSAASSVAAVIEDGTMPLRLGISGSCRESASSSV